MVSDVHFSAGHPGDCRRPGNSGATDGQAGSPPDSGVSEAAGPISAGAKGNVTGLPAVRQNPAHRGDAM